MELVALSSQYANFYAPAFSIRVARDDIMRDRLIAVSQVEVDLQLGSPSRFAFTVTNCWSNKLHAFKTGRGDDILDFLKFGTEVEVFMGYGDAKSVPIAMAGMITEISTDFPESGSPELNIAGYDHGFPMTIGKNSRTWKDYRDSDAVREIASFNNLQSKIETTADVQKQIEQNQQGDWEFIKKLAEQNHFEVYIDERRVLHFARPNDDATAAVKLPYGQGLLSFKPEANLAGQVSKVEVYGWDPKRKERILGVARAGEESGRQGRSAGELLKTLVRDPDKEPTLRFRLPVFTQAEAEKRAKAALNETAKKFLTGDAEAIGLPDLRPDRNVSLDGLGESFSKTYYIQQATHKIDGNGYRTRFKVKETAL